MLYGKIDRYILIAILVVAVLAVVLIFLTRKENNEHHDAQDDLLLAMAEKLRVATNVPESDIQEVKAKEKPSAKSAVQPTEEEEEAIIGIADKICFSQSLTPEEITLQGKFPTEVQKRLAQSRQILGNIINKFLSGSQEFDEYEKEYYETFQAQIDNIINFKKSIDALALKISQGITDFSPEELELKQNHPKPIEDALAEIKKNEKAKGGNGTDNGKAKISTPAKDLKGANPPLSADQRLKIILSLFEDGVPKTVTELATLYAEKAKVNFNKGNISKIFGRLVDEEKLMCERFKSGKVYHGPPTWFENKKLKTHYKQNIKS